MGRIIPYIMEKKKFQTTNQNMFIYYILYSYVFTHTYNLITNDSMFEHVFVTPAVHFSFIVQRFSQIMYTNQPNPVGRLGGIPIIL